MNFRLGALAVAFSSAFGGTAIAQSRRADIIGRSDACSGRIAIGTIALARDSVARLSASSACDSLARRATLRRNPSSLSGLPGLVYVPNAATTPAGTVDFSYDGARNTTAIPTVGRQRNGFIVIGFLPWLTVSGRGTAAVHTTGGTEVRDLSANIKLRLRDEGEVAPAIAIGMQDAGGAASNFENQFIVASKTFLGRARLSAGYAHGTNEPHGAFGGVELGLGSWISAAGEYDGDRLNGLLRLFPFPRVADRFRIQPRIDVFWRQDNDVAIGASLRTLIGGRGEALPREKLNPPTRPVSAARTPGGNTAGRAAVRTPPDAAAATARELTAFGFENVRVSAEHDGGIGTLAVEYENRRFNRDELDALGIVMGVAARHAGDSLSRMRVTIRRVDVPVLTIESGVRIFTDFLHGTIGAAQFADQLMITAAGQQASSGGATEVPRESSSSLKLDLFIRPRVETTVLTDFGITDARVSLLPDAYLQLGRGFVLNGRRAIPVSRSHGFPEALDDPNADRLLLHKAMRLPSGGSSPFAGALTQFSVGRFGHEAVGISNELELSFADGLVGLGSTLAVFGRTVDNLDHSLALGTLRVRRPEWDVTASLTAGRFRNGDVGAAAELSRFFGNTDVGLYFKATEFSPIAGIRVTLPLAPARELAPSRVRLRFPDVHEQSLQSVVLRPENLLRRDVARLLATDHEITRRYLVRDRLNAPTIRNNVDRLRVSVQRWLGVDH